MKPSYIKLHENGELHGRIEKALAMLKSCRLCPNDCRVDRVAGKVGICRAGRAVRVSSAAPHHGEEPLISGRRGSGTVFLSCCTLKCVFCQNHQISQADLGEEISSAELAARMTALQGVGCHNINFVSPTHYLPQILEALALAIGEGLNVPLVYNTNAYDSLEAVELLDGIFDVYMPDIKYSDDEKAARYSGAVGYRDASRAAITEMVRQVGPLVLDDDGVARRGVVVRHLVLPGGAAGSREALDFLAELGVDIQLSLMAQYHPSYRADSYPEIDRRLDGREYKEVVDYARQLGFKYVYAQDLSSAAHYLPDFMKQDPFESQ